MDKVNQDKEQEQDHDQDPVVLAAKRAREASYVMQSMSTSQKNSALQEMIRELKAEKENILKANREDKEDAAKDKLDDALQKRLNLEGDKWDTLLQGLEQVVKVEDPVGRVLKGTEIDTDLELYRVACPIGVLCIIFESRPEAAVQIASLSIKSGNALILKGGREASRSNEVIVKAFRKALPRAGLPADAVQLVSTREEIKTLLGLDKYIDLVIPRGGNALVRNVMDNTKIPVLGHADGICHVYIDSEADVEKAVKIVVDSKTHYPAACNALETLLVHTSAVNTILPKIAAALCEKKVKIHADPTTLPVFKTAYAGTTSASASASVSVSASANGASSSTDEMVVPATEESFRTEYLAFELSVKMVKSLQEAVDHINSHGSHHTDCIVSENREEAERFLNRVDSAGVYYNASTRFADGFRYGFGAEVGVSTNRIHARGPVGLEGLVTYKYRLHGNGHIADSYGNGTGKRPFLHNALELPPDKHTVSLLDSSNSNVASSNPKASAPSRSSKRQKKKN